MHIKNFVGFNKDTKTYVSCLTCGEKIKISPSRIDRKKYCSKKCQNNSMKRHIPWNKGMKKKYTLASDNFRKASILRWSKMTNEERREMGNKISNSKKGFKYSEKSKEKMRNSHLGKKHSPQQIYKCVQGWKKYFSGRKPSSIEIKLYQELKDRGLLFETQKIVGNRFIVDAYIPSLNLIIEADGDYWHSLAKVIERDKRKNQYVKSMGFNILRLSETEIKNNTFKERINKYV